MKRAAVALAITLRLASPSHAARPSHGRLATGRSAAHPPGAAQAWVRPAPPLPMLPSVARVRVEAARDRVVVLEEVNLPRGDWESGGLDLFVAFGAPGTPVALDARLAAIPVGSLEARAEDAGEALPVETAVRQLPSMQLLLGRPTMAGAVVHVKDAQLRRAYA